MTMNTQTAVNLDLVNFRYSITHTPNSESGANIQELIIGYGTHKLTLEYCGSRSTANESKASGEADICLFSMMADVSEATRDTRFIKIDHKEVKGDDVEIAGRINLNRYRWGAAQ